MMPMGDYNISKYINSLLEQINFVDTGVELLDDAAVSEYSWQHDRPKSRSLKRLVNSVALLEDLREASQEEEGNQGKPLDKKQKLLLFSILCLQIEFPLIYSLYVESRPQRGMRHLRSNKRINLKNDLVC